MGVSDILFGKKQKSVYSNSDPRSKRLAGLGGELAESGLQRFQKIAAQDPGEVVRSQIARESQGIRSAGQDTGRRLQSISAQRGLGGSAVGLGQELKTGRDTAQRLASTKASAGERIRNLGLQTAQSAINLGGQTADRFKKRLLQKGGRKGGLAGLAGAGIGAALGGPKGAQIGAGIGTSLQGVA